MDVRDVQLEERGSPPQVSRMQGVAGRLRYGFALAAVAGLAMLGKQQQQPQQLQQAAAGWHRQPSPPKQRPNLADWVAQEQARMKEEEDAAKAAAASASL
jgi:hypothetical protein